MMDELQPPLVTEPGQSEPVAQEKPVKLPSASAALNLIPPFVESMLYGSDKSRADSGRRLIEAIEPRHPALAKRLRRLLPDKLAPVPLMPKNMVAIGETPHSLSDVILADDVRAALLDLVVEHSRAEELSVCGLHPRNRLRLHGPPGNGKTMIASALAKELGLVFLVANYAGVTDSHLGGTAKNIDELFSYANSVPCLLFLDEFDAVGADRSDGSDVREARRSTNQLLVAIDRLRHNCVLVTATNANDLIDKALIRRFDMSLHIAAPTRPLRLACAQQQLDRALTPQVDLTVFAERVADIPISNLSGVTNVCIKLRRDAVLHAGKNLDRIIALEMEDARVGT